jgi:hypothetical protein
MQDEALLDHVCEAWLEVGSYRRQESDFTQFLFKENLSNLHLVLRMHLEHYKAMGFDMPMDLYMHLEMIKDWYSTLLKSEQNSLFATVMGTSWRDVEKVSYMVSENLKSNCKKPPASSIAEEEQKPPGTYIPAGPNSKRASLQQACASIGEKKKISFAAPVSTPVPTGRPPIPPAAQRPSNPMPRIPRPPSASAGCGSGGSGGGSGSSGNSATIPNASNVPVVYYQPPMTKASEFARSRKRSLGDYEKLTNKDQWHRWQRNLMGTAFEHKCENVLDPS